MVQPIKDVFGTIDYLVFDCMLLISAGIGVVFAILDRKKNTQEYLMGGRSLGIFPVAMSSWHGFMSAIALLGTPSEVYRYGTQLFTMSLAFFFVIPSTAYLYLPVFHNLRLTSAYEYLELRFHRYMRTMGSCLFFIHMLMYMPIALYAPALALSEVTGIKVWAALLSTGLVCTFYTSIGGVKAVIWADCFQSIVMLGSLVLVILKGTYDLGGFSAVWQRSLEGDRIEFFRFDFDPTIRHTFWSLVVGGYVTWMGNYAASQSMIQRYLAIGTLQGAQICIWINLPVIILVLMMTCFSGLVVYAYYWDCDPIGVKLVQAADQLFPRFVMETLGGLPGLPGVFVAGVFSGAIATVSGGVNSLAAITLEDFVKVFVKKDLSEECATKITKAIALTFGLSAVGLAFVASLLGQILQAAMTVHGIIGGPMFGIFTLGMFFPCANSWGAAIGLLSGFLVSMWLGIGSFINQPYIEECPMSYSGCTELYYNVTHVNLTGFQYKPRVEMNNFDLWYPYQLSYLWLSAIGFAVVIVNGLAVSILTGCSNGEAVEEKLLSPIVVWLGRCIHFGKFKKVTINQKDISMDKTKSSFISHVDIPKKDSESYLSESKML